MRVKFSRVCLLAAFFVVGFGVFEAGLRLKGGSEADSGFRDLFIADSRIGGVRLRPGYQTDFKTSEFSTHIVINRQGVRDEDVPAKAEGERRIVVLGDSMVLAVQVPSSETFCRLLQDKLNSRRDVGGYRYRVINAGVQGYGPVEELLFYRYVVQDLQPDVVLLVVYVASDAVEAMNSAWLLKPGASRPVVVQAGEGMRLWLRRTVRRSMVLQIVRQRVLDVVGRFENSGTLEMPPSLAMYLPNVPPHIEQGLTATRETVAALQQEVEARGAKLGLVLMPTRFQVSDESWDDMRGRWAEVGIELTRDGASTRFRDALEPLRLPLLDVLPALRAWPAHEQVYFRGAGHLTPVGHQLMATALEQFVIDSRLVDTSPAPDVAATGRR